MAVPALAIALVHRVKVINVVVIVMGSWRLGRAARTPALGRVELREHSQCVRLTVDAKLHRSFDLLRVAALETDADRFGLRLLEGKLIHIDRSSQHGERS
jgi:hypothetical protein